ncbi:helix-turn-helix domain-containing protein (plasmid) [Phyllobacterium sp. A18/5-2]|uniref:helix-turn-helix domain-containing protein n=1 Tax=Phyllobacterium sp. A18/5-2 TaxID=2978392 RepID=UPI0021C78603|nr:helix-turn-helix domain-containing protein [Phyllobacterium sp. A18/5-2]UXN66012.1 helix-turn-helix domain-containing protein [Phyllobacterium sp. A18/5-2]
MVRAHRNGARIISICGGAFVLAAAGLLNGRGATTHWRFAEDLARRYPAVEIDANCLYVDDGDVLTSAGSSAGIDLCLHVVRSVFGAEVANTVARRLVMYSHRQGGQSQLIERPVPLRREADRLSSILDHILANLHHPHTVSSLARHTGMSERTFQRRFRSLTGLPPLKWILGERLEQARILLETSSTAPDDIASVTGLGSAENLRLQFGRHYGVKPADLPQSLCATARGSANRDRADTSATLRSKVRRTPISVNERRPSPRISRFMQQDGRANMSGCSFRRPCQKRQASHRLESAQ